MELIRENKSNEKDGLGDKFAIKFNKNTFAIAPVKASFGLTDEKREVNRCANNEKLFFLLF